MLSAKIIFYIFFYLIEINFVYQYFLFGCRENIKKKIDFLIDAKFFFFFFMCLVMEILLLLVKFLLFDGIILFVNFSSLVAEKIYKKIDVLSLCFLLCLIIAISFHFQSFL